MKQSQPTIGNYILLGGIYGLCPVLFSFQLNDPVLYPQFLGMLGVLLLVMALGIKGWRNENQVKVPLGLVILIGGWLALHLLSLFWATNFPEALFDTMKVAAMVGLFLILLQFFQGQDRWDELGKVMVVAGAIQVAYGMMQVAGIDPIGMMFGEFPTGTHGNPNHLGSAVMLILPLVAWAILRLGMAWKVAGIITLLTLVVLMYFTGARAVWLSLVLWVIITTIWLVPMLWRRPGMRRWFWLGLGGMMMVFALTWIGFRKVGGKKAASHQFEFLWQDDIQIRPEHNSLEMRYIVWNRTMDMIADHPLTGVGAGNWKIVIPKYGIKGFDDEGRYGMDFVMRAHNDFLQAGAEMGFLGLLILLGLYGAGFWMAVGMARKGETQEDRSKGMLILLAFAGMLVDASFSFPQERIFQTLMFWTLLALLASEWGRGKKRSVGLPEWWKFTVVVVLVIALVVTVFRVKGDATMHKMMVAKAKKNWILTQKEAGKASNWAIDIEPISAAPPAWYEGLAQLSTGRNAEGLVSMQDAQTISPWHLAVRTNLAAAYEMNGKHVEAAVEYENLLETFPDFEESWLNLAVVYLHLGEFEKVRYSLEKVGSFRTDPRYAAILAELERLNH